MNYFKKYLISLYSVFSLTSGAFSKKTDIGIAVFIALVCLLFPAFIPNNSHDSSLVLTLKTLPYIASCLLAYVVYGCSKAPSKLIILICFLGALMGRIASVLSPVSDQREDFLTIFISFLLLYGVSSFLDRWISDYADFFTKTKQGLLFLGLKRVGTILMLRMLPFIICPFLIYLFSNLVGFVLDILRVPWLF